MSSLSKRCIRFLTRPNFIVLGLMLCLVKVASAQLLTISCVPATGPVQVGVPYSATCTAANGIAPFSWAIVAGTLPPGIALAPSADTTSAAVSGTPTTTGAYSYTVQVTDSTPVLPLTAQQPFAGTINPAPPPVITSLNPASIAAGGPAFTLTVNGSGFASDAVVQWNGSALTGTTFVSSTQLTAPVPANLIVFAGVAQIAVVSGGATSNIIDFAVNPIISSLSPSSATAGSPAFTLVVNGAGFTTGSVVQWNGASLVTNLISSTQLQATVLANLIASPGTSQVTVISNTLTSNSVNFTVTAAASITSISPTSAIAGGPAFTLTVNGSGFQSGAAVQWNGNALTTTFVSASRMTASVPANLIANAGTAQITVLSGAVTSNAVTFTVNPAPVVSAISPTTATAGGPAFTLTVNGTGFSSGSTIDWNTATLATRFVSATQLTATVPARLIANAGTIPITVVTGGVTSNAVNFTVVAPPVISNLSPSAATAGGPGFTLTVNGSGFGGDAVVNWNQTPLATSVVSANRVTAPVLASFIATAGTAQISVSSGGVTSNAVNFTIVAGPAISALTPASTAAGGPAFTLTITGTGFASGAAVQWNSTPLQTVVVSANQITASVTADLIATVGGARITVISGGATSNAVTFAVVAAPVISTISPSTVAAGGPDFHPFRQRQRLRPDTTVKWNGTALPTPIVNAASSPGLCTGESYRELQYPRTNFCAFFRRCIKLGSDRRSLLRNHSDRRALHHPPNQQLNVGIQFASAPPTALQGTLHLTFAPSIPGLPAGYIDTALQFAAGGTTLQLHRSSRCHRPSRPLTGKTIQTGPLQAR